MKKSKRKKLIEEKLKIIECIKNLNKAEKWLLRKHTFNCHYGFPKNLNEIAECDIVDCDIPSLYPDMWKIDNNISYKELYKERLKMIQDKLKNNFHKED